MKNLSGKIKIFICILFIAAAIGYFAFYLLRVIPTTPFGFEISSSNPYAMDAFARSEDGFLFDDPFGDGDGMRGGSSLYMRDCKVKISGVITSGKYRFRVYNENQERSLSIHSRAAPTAISGLILEIWGILIPLLTESPKPDLKAASPSICILTIENMNE